MTEQAKKLIERQNGGRSPAGDRPDIEDRVLHYFRQHANAMDSVDGIARFWVREDPSVVERSLQDLHQRGLLRRRLIAGTEFYSLQREAAPAGGSHLRPAGAASPARPETRGRILVVDDDESVRKFIVQTLSEEGHSVAAAEDGRRAIAMFGADPFDLVVTDLMMPGTSGMEVLQAVKQRRPATEVIVVTGHASLETAIEALRLGAYDLITKPLDDIELLHRGVERALERQRLSTDNRLLVENLQARNVEMKETVARLAAVNEIGKATTRLLDLTELYDSLVRLVSQHLKVLRVSVLITEPGSDTMELVASVGIADEDICKARIRVGEGIAGRVAASQSPLLVSDIEKSNLRDLRGPGRYNTGSFMITPLNISYPIRFHRRRVGVINVADKISGEPFTDQDMEFLATLTSQVAVAIENARLVKEMEGGYLNALVALIRAAEQARTETRGHSVRVAELADAVARELGLSDARRETLRQAAALHEIGRVCGGAETDRDGPGMSAGGCGWGPASIMAAEQILAPIASLAAAREIILHSADRFDAAPVRFGADRSATPIESRILAICEQFVRLAGIDRADPVRSYDALQSIRRDVGRRHDPDMVAALVRVVEGERS